MTYEECRLKLEEILDGTVIIEGGTDSIGMLNDRGNLLIYMSSKEQYVWDTNYKAFYDLADVLKDKILDVLVELIKTPIEKRSQKQRYHLRHKFIGGKDNFLSVPMPSGLSDGYSSDMVWEGRGFHQFRFTREEIDEFKRQNNTNLEDFIEIPIKEDNFEYSNFY